MSATGRAVNFESFLRSRIVLGQSWYRQDVKLRLATLKFDLGIRPWPASILPDRGLDPVVSNQATNTAAVFFVLSCK